MSGDKNKYLFNDGAERQEELGLNIDLTRYRAYDPAIGRWWQVDPKADVLGQESWTPYHYALNNPVLNNDPNGDIPPLLIAWAVVEVGLAVYDAYETYSTLTDGNASTTEKVVTVTGAAAGFLLPGGGYSATDDVVEQGVKVVNKVVDKRGMRLKFRIKHL